MVGLPTENNDDIQATTNLLINIKRKKIGKKLIIFLVEFYLKL